MQGAPDFVLAVLVLVIVFIFIYWIYYVFFLYTKRRDGVFKKIAKEYGLEVILNYEKYSDQNIQSGVYPWRTVRGLFNGKNITIQDRLTLSRFEKRTPLSFLLAPQIYFRKLSGVTPAPVFLLGSGFKSYFIVDGQEKNITQDFFSFSSLPSQKKMEAFLRAVQ